VKLSFFCCGNTEQIFDVRKSFGKMIQASRELTYPYLDLPNMYVVLPSLLGFFLVKKKAQTLHTKGKSRYIPTKHLGQGLDMLGLHHPDASPIQQKYIFRISYHMNQFSLALHKQGVFSGEPTRIIWEMLWVGPLLTLSICS